MMRIESPRGTYPGPIEAAEPIAQLTGQRQRQGAERDQKDREGKVGNIQS